MRSAARERGPEGKRLIRGATAAFVITCAVLLLMGDRLVPDRGQHAEPGYAVHERAQPSPDGTFQVTLDASDHKRWIHFDLAAGQVRPMVEGDAAADLVVRRYMLRAPHGAMGLGSVPLGSAHVENPVWINDEKVGGELENPALKRWYTYSYWSHLLRSRGETYAVRLAGGGVAYMELKSYNCLPDSAGCLTIRYRLDLERTRKAMPSIRPSVTIKAKGGTK